MRLRGVIQSQPVTGLETKSAKLVFSLNGFLTPQLWRRQGIDTLAYRLTSVAHADVYTNNGLTVLVNLPCEILKPTALSYEAAYQQLPRFYWQVQALGWAWKLGTWAALPLTRWRGAKWLWASASRLGYLRARLQPATAVLASL